MLRRGDCTLYPDKKKGPGAAADGRESTRIAEGAGHWRDKSSTLVKKKRVRRRHPQDTFFFLR